MTPEELPEGWVSARLGDICSKPQYGWTTAGRPGGSGLRLLRTTDISSGRIDWGSVPACAREPNDPEKYLVRPGDILVARAGSVGVSHVVEECPPAVFASYLIRLRPVKEISSKYVGLFLRSPHYWSAILERSAGIAIPNINATTLAALTLPVPPLAEQRRIVAAVEALLGRVNAARERLSRVSATMKRMRQAVLAAACRGRLTGDWRDDAGTGQTGSDLVGRALPTDLRLDASPETLYELPETWCWASLDQLRQTGRPIIYGIIKPGPHIPDGVPYVRVLDMKERHINLGALRRTSAARAAKFSRATLAVGDVLVSKDGTIGRVAIVPVELEGANITQHVVRFTPSGLLNRTYLSLAIQSPSVQTWLTGERKGVALQGVNVEDFRRTPVPVPPRPEQDEIVDRVGVLISLADAIEHRVAAVSTRAEQLTQAILAKAFRGQLVPTEAELGSTGA